ncbi:PPOX class F420-dependent oxidoreductase [Kitasatospora sp. NPDC004745]|uniref:PPOX class F420-dependent oxidoreductase n=1 Tax=Kitasatospora sp. NPDC004745 TaxID=3364019 RepID=UPI003697DDFA
MDTSRPLNAGPAPSAGRAGASSATAPATASSAASARLAELAAAKYLLFTTHRRNGTPVNTPVWVARDGDALVFTTVTRTGKVKRLRNRSDVLVGPSDIRGTLLGEQVPATAVLDSARAPAYRRLLRRKYGPLCAIALTANVLRFGKGGTIGVRVTLD